MFNMPFMDVTAIVFAVFFMPNMIIKGFKRMQNTKQQQLIYPMHGNSA